MAQELTVADQLAIRDVIARYAWALDTGDVEEFVSCFCGDGALVWDAFEQPMRWDGADALRHFATYFRDLPSSAGRQHHVTNVLLEPCEGGARSRSYAAVALRQGDGPHLLNVMGYYEDRFRLEQGRWGLAERIIRDWSGPILQNFAGQTGERVPRPIPPPLTGAAFTPGGG